MPIRRGKVFGEGRAIRLDKNARARVVAFARAVLRRPGPGRPSSAIAVLRALLSYLGNRTGRCFPSYKAIAARAGCSRDTVCEALKRLEAAKVLTWQHRLYKIRERHTDLFGITYWRWRVARTSNAYRFNDPKPAANIPTGKEEDLSSSYSSTAQPADDVAANPLERALRRLGAAIEARNRIEQARAVA
jgi:Helix-turn-helix domain